MAPKKAASKRTTRLNPGATSNPNQAPLTTTTTVTNAQLQAMIDQGVNAVLAARDANRTGDDSHTSGAGVRRTERAMIDQGVNAALAARDANQTGDDSCNAPLRKEDVTS
nr:hypothetical protein [Tanacetum cinerariifolium]